MSLHRSEGIRRLALFAGGVVGPGWAIVVGSGLGRMRSEEWVLFFLFMCLVSFAAWLLVRAVAWVIDGFRSSQS